MPKVKTLRDDILRRPEIDAMLEQVRSKMVAALIALLWLFGKRITENLRLRRQDVWTEGEYLYVRFAVLKKAKKSASLSEKYYVKRIRVSHPYARYVLDYIGRFKSGEDGLFPINRTKAWRLLKDVNPDVYPHFFRHSLATSMAERGASIVELMSWFDWDRTSTAMKYVKRGTKMIEKWADRAF